VFQMAKREAFFPKSYELFYRLKEYSPFFK